MVEFADFLRANFLIMEILEYKSLELFLLKLGFGFRIRLKSVRLEEAKIGPRNLSGIYFNKVT